MNNGRRHQFEESPALAAARKVAAGLGQRREGVLKQVVHRADVGHEVEELEPEDVEGVAQHRLELRLAARHEFQLLFQRLAHVGQYQLRVDALVAVHLRT